MTQFHERAYIVAARRTAIGRVGGLHRHRRVEELAARAIEAALKDVKLSPRDVDQLILGNASDGGNPARLAGLAAGIADTAAALTIDRQCASGLDAVLAALRLVAAGEAGVVAAGGAESLTNAPWRLARPRSALQGPRFLESDAGPHAADIEAAEALAAAAGIRRERQDAFADQMRRLGGKRNGAGLISFGPAMVEARDEAPLLPEGQTEVQPFRDDGGTLTAVNTTQPGDGAAFLIIASEAAYRRLGAPPALRLVGSATIGARPGAEAAAPIDAVRALCRRVEGWDPLRADQVELNESSAAQAIAFTDALELVPEHINLTGGMLASGRPFAAASAVLVVRLFAGLLGKANDHTRSRIGLAVTGALGGQGVAALFETVNG